MFEPRPQGFSSSLPKGRKEERPWVKLSDIERAFMCWHQQGRSFRVAEPTPLLKDLFLRGLGTATRKLTRT